MRCFPPPPACPFSEEAPHRNRQADRPYFRSRDNPARRQQRLGRKRRAPTRRQSFSFNFLMPAILPGGFVRSATAQHFAKRDVPECVGPKARQILTSASAAISSWANRNSAAIPRSFGSAPRQLS